jgi:hypothetical protein
MTKKKSTTALISDLKRKTRKTYSSEEKDQNHIGRIPWRNDRSRIMSQGRHIPGRILQMEQRLHGSW